MIGQIFALDDMRFPLVLPKGWVNLGKKLRYFTLPPLLTQLAPGILTIGIALFLAGLGTGPQATGTTKPSTINAAYNWITTANKSGRPKAAQAKAVAPAAPVCAPRLQNIFSTQFTLCPDFAVDYSLLPDGTDVSKHLNIYNGAPEGNQEAQLYTNDPQNLRIQHGSLILQALSKRQDGYKYTSARLDTKGKHDFLYGKIEINAMLPNGIGTWPAIWLLPSTGKYAALSPDTDFTRYLNDGEIDIAEAVGTDPYSIYGIAHSLAHPITGPQDYYGVASVPDSTTAYHDYGIEWTPTKLTFTVDDRPYFSIEKKPGADYRSWPYDQPFYLVLNLALGGTWGGISRAQYPPDGVDAAVLPTALKIQSIRYYPLTQKIQQQ